MCYTYIVVVNVKIKIEEKTGELIKVISQFQGQGHLPKLLGKAPDPVSGLHVMELEFKTDVDTVRSLAEALGYQIVDISEVESAVQSTRTRGGSPVSLDDLRTRYISAVGPIGGALFDEALEGLGDGHDTPGGRRQLVERLVGHIDDQDEIIRFYQYAGVEI